jgi:hypothetical protein
MRLDIDIIRYNIVLKGRYIVKGNVDVSRSIIGIMTGASFIMGCFIGLLTDAGLIRYSCKSRYDALFERQ